jgi:heme-degrading monooxygenase HmoA
LSRVSDPHALRSAAGVIAAWQGSKFEELYTRVYLLLWKDLESSHRFFTSSSFDRLITDIQPALNGRKITWKQHTLLKHSSLSDLGHFDTVVQSHSGAIEVAWTKVVEGKVAGYYEQFDSVVQAILENEPGCDGFFLSPQIEDPQSQVLLINWKSVDVSATPAQRLLRSFLTLRMGLLLAFLWLSRLEQVVVADFFLA